jgi:molybdopterin synthase catalytic subunit
MEDVMARWLLILTLLVGSSTAWAQSGQATHLSAMTDNAEAATRDAEHRVAMLAQHRAELARCYQDELDAIDRLKTQRPSWRHDRELRDSLSSSAETANQLVVASRELERANISLSSARRAYLVAIDAERSAGVASLRGARLDRARALLGPQVKVLPRPIVFPDLEVDPLADPEELEQRAVELRASEDMLSRQLAGLAAQAAELDHLAQLRKQHDRAGYLFDRDDDQPRHNTAVQKSPDGATTDDGTSSGGLHLPTIPGTFENAVIVLSNVIDASTINSFAAAQRSGDPEQRAEAAHQAHDAVAKRLDQVRKKRLEIEARAMRLRSRR